MSALINCEEITFSYEQKTIFSNLNLELKTGQTLWIQGGNGSGKTTLLRILLDFLRPQSGKIQRLPDTKLGWAPSVDNSFFPRLSGLENLDFFINLYPQKIKANFDLSNPLIQEILKTPFYQMSSGMKQILIILRSLLVNPDLVLWDEPLRSLDSTQQTYIINLLKKLQSENKTIILTSHNDLSLKDVKIEKLIIREHQLAAIS